MEMSAAEFTFGFVLRELYSRNGHGWLGSKRPAELLINRTSTDQLNWLTSFGIEVSERVQLRLREVSSPVQLLERFQLKGVGLDSHLGLLGWLKGHYPLQLRQNIPSPEEMLLTQCRGERIVTWLSGPQWEGRPIDRHAGPFEFLLHDLEHAHKFFGDPISHSGQVAFFKKLSSSQHHFQKWLEDPLFVKDFNYLKSDMNSHPVHLLKYLKAIVMTAALRQTQQDHIDLDWFWNELFSAWQLSDLEFKSALRLNNPGLENAQDQVQIAHYFASSIH